MDETWGEPLSEHILSQFPAPMVVLYLARVVREGVLTPQRAAEIYAQSRRNEGV